MGLCLTAAVIPLLARAADRMVLMYYPYPPYTMAPEFNTWIGAAISLLAVPPLIQMFRASWAEFPTGASAVDGQES